MRIERVSVSLDWKSTEGFNSDRHSISLTACLESGDVLEEVEQQLYEQCRAYLEKVSANGRNGEKKNSTAKPSENKDAQPQQPQTPPTPPKPENKPEPKKDSNRPVKQLIDELKIRSANHAGYLRMQGQISYKEWKALHDYFNNKEIEDFDCDFYRCR